MKHDLSIFNVGSFTFGEIEWYLKGFVFFLVLGFTSISQSDTGNENQQLMQNVKCATQFFGEEAILFSKDTGLPRPLLFSQEQIGFITDPESLENGIIRNHHDQHKGEERVTPFCVYEDGSGSSLETRLAKCSKPKIGILPSVNLYEAFKGILINNIQSIPKRQAIALADSREDSGNNDDASSIEKYYREIVEVCSKTVKDELILETLSKVSNELGLK